MIRIHPTAEVSDQAQIGDGTAIWHQAQVRERARIGQNCILGKGVYVDFDVQIGDRCKLQNGAYVYHGVTLEDGVFVGPGVILTNDRLPRAINPDGSLKADDDWEVRPSRSNGGLRSERAASSCPASPSASLPWLALELSSPAACRIMDLSSAIRPAWWAMSAAAGGRSHRPGVTKRGGTSAVTPAVKSTTSRR